jgi:5-methyltetrahydrofolate--homocysteine methyltransferase
VEDVVLNRRDDATERMIEFAATFKAGDKKEEATLEWRSAGRQAPLACAGARHHQWIVEDTEEVRQQIAADGGRPST